MSMLVPPWVCDQHPTSQVEQRLAERYSQAVQRELVAHAQERLFRRSRKALLERLAEGERSDAYLWLAEAVLDTPDVIRNMTVEEVMTATVGETRSIEKVAGCRLCRLEGHERLWLSRSLQERAKRRQKAESKRESAVAKAGL